MKKALKFFLIITISVLGSATTYAQISINPEAGLNCSDYRLKTSDLTLNTYMKTGLRAGFVVDIAFSSRVNVEPGIYYVQNGYGIETASRHESTSIHCIEFPLNIMFTPDTRTKNLSIGCGIYVAYNVAGKLNYDGKTKELEFATEPSSNQYMVGKNRDYGWRILSACKLSEKFYLKAHFQMGMVNLFSNFPDSYYDVKNYNFGVAVGYKMATFKHKGKTK